MSSSLFSDFPVSLRPRASTAIVPSFARPNGIVQARSSTRELRSPRQQTADRHRIVERHGVGRPTGAAPIPDLPSAAQKVTRRRTPTRAPIRNVAPLRVRRASAPCDRRAASPPRGRRAAFSEAGSGSRSCRVGGEADQRAAIVVAIAIEGGIEHALHRILHGTRQQQRDQHWPGAPAPRCARFPLPRRPVSTPFKRTR